MLFVLLTVGVWVLRTYTKWLPKIAEPYRNFPSVDVKPTLFWFCDSGTNARNWNDFGGRSSKTPNRGYHVLALRNAIGTQPECNVIPIFGREQVYDHLPDVSRQAMQLPPKLWRAWLIANLMAKRGGLAMDGDSTLCIGPRFFPLLRDDASVFGVYPDEEIVSPLTATSPGPAPYVGWSRVPFHPAWVSAAQFYNDLVERGPTAWSAALARRADLTVWETQKRLGCTVIRGPDGGRLPNGKLRQLEDVLGNKVDPMADILPGTVYLSYDGEDLAKRYEFNWFLRLSPDQILGSQFVWAKLQRTVL
jgi:hypothetical protein